MRDCAQATLEYQIKVLQSKLSGLKQSPLQAHLAEVTEDNYDQPHSLDDTFQHIQDCIDAFREEDSPIEVINACVVANVEEAWFLDSGASSHVTGNSHLLRDITDSRIPHIKTAGGQLMPVAGQGTVITSNSSREIKEIHRVLYLPGVKTNLLSVGKLIDIGYKVLFESTKCIIYDRKFPKQIFLSGTWDPNNKLYRIETSSNTTTPTYYHTTCQNILTTNSLALATP